MNIDPEKNRAEYVQHLENQVQHLQRQLQELQAQERWIPHVAATMDSVGDTARLTLAWGGKRVTTTFTQQAIRESSIVDVVTAVVDSFVVNLVAERLREVVEPEVLRVVNGSNSIVRAGKW